MKSNIFTSFKEYVAECFSNTAIFEMAYERKVARERVRNIADILLEHLLKLIVFPESVHADHWKNEVFSFIENVNKITVKPNNQRLRGHEIFDILIGEPLGSGRNNEPDGDKVLRNIMYLKFKYKEENAIDIDVNSLTDRLTNFYKDFANKTSVREVSVDEIADLVEKFIKGGVAK